MPELVRQALDFALAYPMHTVGGAACAILYLRLMLSGPRHY